ncbi:MAG: alanine--tRNA ligase [Ezakiella sp.]
MENIELHDIREKFLKFFESKGHLLHPSYSLIPKNDKSLLLIGAGMAPLKKYFTGEETPPAKRMTTSQKCVRTGDIDNVGKTLRHLTFFEMLGNFSFGDYFKTEAIHWAWEFLTEVMKLPAEKLWVSVYEKDDEAYRIWHDEIGIPAERIVKLGKEDNFWELEVGPSGPDSEIHYDKGEEFGCGSPDCKPGCDCDRFLEVWNLVFTQFDKDKNGEYHPLPHPNIDTGMGLERIACIMENVDSVYDIKAIRKIMDTVADICGKKYGDDKDDDVHFRIIGDHSRAITFLISDGVVPSNEGRGYVLRKLIRRASRHGMLLGIKQSFLEAPVTEVIESWGRAYPELIENKKVILEVLNTEEERFQRTIVQGTELLTQKIADLKSKMKKVLSGEDAFVLYDTYGFPADLTEEILEDEGLSYDKEGLKEAMDEQRTRAREALDKSDSGWKKDSKIEFDSEIGKFSGYEMNETTTKITDIYVDGKKTDELPTEAEGIVILEDTPFYGESGGQVGDIGEIIGDDFRLEVLDTQKTKDGLYLQICKTVDGVAKKGAEVSTKIDTKRRDDIRRNHSATHLLHAALREVLGTHVHQAGSLVNPERLRFDFSHYQAMTEEEIKEVERIVNEKVLESIPVVTEIKSLKEAKDEGVTGLFESKYGDVVRVLKMGKFSMELCGGTHVRNTSEIGLFKIVSETGVAAGVRRIEAVTGHASYKYVLKNEELIKSVENRLKTTRENIEQRIGEMEKHEREQRKEIESIKAKLLGNAASDMTSEIKEINGIKVLAKVFEGVEPNELKNIADEIRNKEDAILVILASKNGGGLNLLVAASKGLVKEGINSGNIVRNIAKALGGNGGGRPDMAMAGAKDVDKVNEVFQKIADYIK